MPNAIPLPVHGCHPGIDGTQSTSPAEGSGGHYVQGLPWNNVLFRGLVEDTFPANAGVLVSLYGYTRALPCVLASDIQSRLFGAQVETTPAVGSEVVVYVTNGSHYGIVIGSIPTVEDSKVAIPRPMVTPEGGVNTLSKTEAFNAEDWQVHPQYMFDHGAGRAIDVVPGDWGVSNDLNLFLGILRTVAVLKGSDLAKVEAFTVDDLLRLTGYNSELLTSCGEVRHYNDQGHTTREEMLAFVQHEALGQETAGKPLAVEQEVSLKTQPTQIGLKGVEERMSGKWRYREYVGFLGDMIHRMVSRPAAKPETLDASETQPDAGVFSEHVSRSGRVTWRSLAGLGMHKVDRIPIPKRKYFFGEPHTPDQVKPVALNDFDAKDSQAGTHAIWCKLRDYFAYVHSCLIPARIYDVQKAQEISMPENSKTPNLAFVNAIPGKGGFFRSPTPAVDISTQGGVLPEAIADQTLVTPGHAWAHILPDGSFSVRDIWGSTIETRDGHIILSASKGIQMIAGDSVVTLAGKDIVGRARQSIDYSATLGQLRLKSERTAFLHSQSGGIQLTCPAAEPTSTTGTPAMPLTGTAYDIPGLVFNSGSNVAIVANTVTNYVSQAIYTTNQQGDAHAYPMVYRDIAGEVNLVRNSGVSYKLGDPGTTKNYTWLINGGVYGTGDTYFDGTGYYRGNVVYKGSLNSSSFANQPDMKTQLARDYPDLVLVYSHLPFNTQNLGAVQFSYRNAASYGTTDAMWFESDWQRDLAQGLDTWTETPIANTYPYPGVEHYTKMSKYYTYKEVNVDVNGAPHDRQAMTATGGALTGHTWQEFKI